MLARRGRSAGLDVPMDAGLTAADVRVMVEVREDNRRYVAEAIRRELAEALDDIGSRMVTYAQEICPVDTGRLRNSITHRLGGSGGRFGFPGESASVGEGDLEVVIGTDVPYATYVEEGTRRMAARPYLRPAAVNHADEYRQVVRDHMEGAD